MYIYKLVNTIESTAVNEVHAMTV